MRSAQRGAQVRATKVGARASPRVKDPASMARKEETSKEVIKPNLASSTSVLASVAMRLRRALLVWWFDRSLRIRRPKGMSRPLLQLQDLVRCLLEILSVRYIVWWGCRRRSWIDSSTMKSTTWPRHQRPRHSCHLHLHGRLRHLLPRCFSHLDRTEEPMHSQVRLPNLHVHRSLKSFRPHQHLQRLLPPVLMRTPRDEAPMRMWTCCLARTVESFLARSRRRPPKRIVLCMSRCLERVDTTMSTGRVPTVTNGVGPVRIVVARNRSARSQAERGRYQESMMVEFKWPRLRLRRLHPCLVQEECMTQRCCSAGQKNGANINLYYNEWWNPIWSFMGKWLVGSSRRWSTLSWSVFGALDWGRCRLVSHLCRAGLRHSMTHYLPPRGALREDCPVQDFREWLLEHTRVGPSLKPTKNILTMSTGHSPRQSTVQVSALGCVSGWPILP